MRAQRRHDQVRIKKRAKRIVSQSWHSVPRDEWINKNANNLKNCQCAPCCNPRRVFKSKNKASLTLKEQINLIDFNDLAIN